MFTNQMRFTGFSGMDIQGMVVQMMRAESVRLDRLHQRRSRLQWQQEALQGVTTNLRAFQSRHLDFVNPTYNLRSFTTFSTFNGLAQINGVTNASVTTTGSVNAVPGTYHMTVLNHARADAFAFRPAAPLLTSARPIAGGNFQAGDSINVRADGGTTREIRFTAEEANIMNNGTAWEVQNMLNTRMGEIYGFVAGGAPSNSPTSVVGGAGLQGLFDAFMADYTIGYIDIEINGVMRSIDVSDATDLDSFVAALNTGIANYASGVSFSVNDDQLVLTSDGSNTLEYDGSGLLTQLGMGAFLLEAHNEVQSRIANFRVTGEGPNRQIDLDVNTGHTVTVTTGALGEDRARHVQTGTSRSASPAGGWNNTMARNIIGEGLSFTIGGETINISADDIFTSSVNITSARSLTDAINAALGREGVEGVSFTTVSGANNTFSFRMTYSGTEPVHVNSVTGGFLSNVGIEDDINFSNALIDMGFESGQNNRLDLSRTIGDVMGVVGGTSDAPNTFQLNGITVRYHEDMTVQELMSAIARTGVANLTFDNLSGEFRMTATQTGFEGRLMFDGFEAGSALGAFFTEGITDPDRVSVAQDARVTVTAPNGVTHTLERSTNTFSFNGITFNFTEATPLNEQITIAISQDIERPLSAITQFVESFNTLVNELRGMHSTARARPPGDRHGFFEPLTAEQRREMSDREIEEWEEQARLGILHRDPALREITDQLRRAVTTGVRLPDGRMMNLFEIGITTTRDGTLEIDEQRLRNALETRGEDVAHLFAGGPGGVVNSQNFRQRQGEEFGLASRINDIMHMQSNPGTGSLVTRAGNPGQTTQNEMLRRIQDMDRNIENMNRTLARRENSLFVRFAAMEQAVMRGNQQMDMLWTMMGM